MNIAVLELTRLSSCLLIAYFTYSIFIECENNFTVAFTKERFSKIEKSVILCQSTLTGEFNSEKYNIEDYYGWYGKVLIFTANDDNGFPYHEELRDQYPNVEEIIFENVGHMGTLLKRDEYHTILNRFLDTLN